MGKGRKLSWWWWGRHNDDDEDVMTMRMMRMEWWWLWWGCHDDEDEDVMMMMMRIEWWWQWSWPAGVSEDGRAHSCPPNANADKLPDHCSIMIMMIALLMFTSMRVRGMVTIQRQRSETAKLAMNTFLTSCSLDLFLSDYQTEGQSDIHILALSPGCAHLSLSQYCCQHQNVASDSNWNQPVQSPAVKVK